MYSSSNLIAKAMTYQIPTASKSRSRRFQKWLKQHKKGKGYTNDNREYYREIYLKSSHWRNLKKQKLRLSPFCEKCGSKRYLNVHHLAYQSLYNVNVEDLQTLCRFCHKKEHAVVVK